jgi:hypothetical protein
MKKRSKQNNPEQKTRNGDNSKDVELGNETDLVKLAKKKYEQRGVQPTRSKIHPK